MDQQTYPVACECGREHQVSGGQAGSEFACGCGRRVEVPSLGALKRSVGQSAVSADLEIEHRLGDGSLPEETHCVFCGERTRGVEVVGVVCEREEVQTPIKWWYWLLLPLGLWVALLLLVAQIRGRTRTLGRDVAFRLPVRVCPDCGPKVDSIAGAREALDRTPLYARLLAKYPHAEVHAPA